MIVPGVNSFDLVPTFVFKITDDPLFFSIAGEPPISYRIYSLVVGSVDLGYLHISFAPGKRISVIPVIIAATIIAIVSIIIVNNFPVFVVTIGSSIGLGKC